MQITIPANIRAAVTLPGPRLETASEGGPALEAVPGIAVVAQSDQDVQLELDSGTYSFEYPI